MASPEQAQPGNGNNLARVDERLAGCIARCNERYGSVDRRLRDLRGDVETVQHDLNDLRTDVKTRSATLSFWGSIIVASLAMLGGVIGAVLAKVL